MAKVVRCTCGRHPHGDRFDLHEQSGRSLGPDTGGGAIYVLGSKNGVLIVGSTFSHNAASNAGAVGCCSQSWTCTIAYSPTTRRSAMAPTTTTPPSVPQSTMASMRLDQAATAGRSYSDGNSVNITLCGDAILNNSAGKGVWGRSLLHQQRHGRDSLHRRHHHDGKHGRTLDGGCLGQCHQRRAPRSAPTPRASR